MDLFLISLGDAEAVLEVNWLRTLGPISWDFEHMMMEFSFDGQPALLQGISTELGLHPSTFLLSITPDHDQGLQTLLTAYGDVFSAPRACTHKIVLSLRTDLVVVRPYRYPHAQKEEIERQCTEMLAKGIILPSTSTFSAPVLLVRKSNNSWRLCVDYRALNRHEIKDKFPIPFIDELLEELNGAKYFSQLDLRAGFHQVLMDP